MKTPASNRDTLAGRCARAIRLGFTLIEIMVVVAVMGLILAAGVPSLYKLFHREGFRRTLNDIAEVCQAARARAILQGVTTHVVFYPREGRCEVSGGSGSGGSGGLAHTAQIDAGTVLEMLDVNLTERKADEIARVQFHPEGTCDEMLIILRSDRGEQRGLMLETTTGLVSILSMADLQNLRSGRL